MLIVVVENQWIVNTDSGNKNRLKFKKRDNFKKAASMQLLFKNTPISISYITAKNQCSDFSNRSGKHVAGVRSAPSANSF